MEEIVNKVAASGLITLNLEEMIPQENYRVIDMKDFLWQEFVLKEKMFRETLASTDWSDYSGAIVGLHCSNDAIVPTWAWMLLTVELEPYAKRIVMANETQLKAQLLTEHLQTFSIDHLQEARVIIKGCSEAEIPLAAYTVLTQRLKPIVKSLMFGEPCSTVPVFKQKAKK